MTIEQRAALLDQLKLPIEEAPRDTTILGIFTGGAVALIWWSNTWGEWRHNTGAPAIPTHFLPLPKPGPVEFEIVPKDQPAPFIQGCISCQGKGGWVTVAGFEVCNDCKGEGRR